MPFQGKRVTRIYVTKNKQNEVIQSLNCVTAVKIAAITMQENSS